MPPLRSSSRCPGARRPSPRMSATKMRRVADEHDRDPRAHDEAEHAPRGRARRPEQAVGSASRVSHGLVKPVREDVDELPLARSPGAGRGTRWRATSGRSRRRAAARPVLGGRVGDRRGAHARRPGRAMASPGLGCGHEARPWEAEAREAGTSGEQRPRAARTVSRRGPRSRSRRVLRPSTPERVLEVPSVPCGSASSVRRTATWPPSRVPRSFSSTARRSRGPSTSAPTRRSKTPSPSGPSRWSEPTRATRASGTRAFARRGRGLAGADRRRSSAASARGCASSRSRACRRDELRTIEMFGDRVAVLIHDKALLDEEDIFSATFLVYGKSDGPLVKKIGPRWFLTPGPIGSAGRRRARARRRRATRSSPRSTTATGTRAPARGPRRPSARPS